MYHESIQQMSRMLKNFLPILEKAAQYADQKKFEVSVLLHARLAPDQFHFIRQIQIATDSAKGAAARLAGKDIPVFEDNEKTLPELQERIKKTIAFLQGFKASDFNGASERKMTFSFIPDKHLEAPEFVQGFALPNFYFHLTTAYAILRNNGMDVGKMDFLGPVDFK